MAMGFLFMSIFSFGAMEYMHQRVHDIQQLGRSDAVQVQAALAALEDTQHGRLFSMTPTIALLAAAIGLALGLAVAVSIIRPLGLMGQAMRRMASGQFSQPVQVDNQDELGELALHINDSALQLAKLQEAVIAEERARALAERVTEVTFTQEEERRRISRELHDGLGPSLAAIGSRMKVAQKQVRSDPSRVELELEEMANLLRGHVQEIRRLIHGLRPPALDQLGLVGAVKQQVEQFSQETGVQALFNAPSDMALDPLVEVTVLRVVQECLTNIRRHSQATHAEIEFYGMRTGLVLTVRDNGKGFDPELPQDSKKGLGILGMQERAELLGGSLAVQSSLGKGCRVVMHIPSKESQVGPNTSAPRG